MFVMLINIRKGIEGAWVHHGFSRLLFSGWMSVFTMSWFPQKLSEPEEPWVHFLGVLISERPFPGCEIPGIILESVFQYPFA